MKHVSRYLLIALSPALLAVCQLDAMGQAATTQHDMTNDLTALKSKIGAAWKAHPPAKKRAVIAFTAGYSTPKSVVVHNTSGDKTFDESARAAVISQMPVKAKSFTYGQKLQARFDPYVKVVDVYPEPVVDFGPYMKVLQKTIKENWFPPKAEQSRHTIVKWCVLADGSITDVKLSQSSGVPEADQAALKAIRRIPKFRPLPAGSPDSVDIDFTFDYNVKRKEDELAKKNAGRNIPKNDFEKAVDRLLSPKVQTKAK